MPLQFRKGTAAQRTAATEIPAAGEPWFTYDDGQLYVGDGITPGGINIGSNASVNSLANVTTIEEATAAISGYSITSNVVTVTTALAHSYYQGLIVTIAGSSTASLNGTHTITAIPGVSSFSFALVGSDIATTATDGSVTPQIPNGNALIWNQAESRWEDGIPGMGLDDLTDVDTTSNVPTDGQYLVWDDTGGNWVPSTLSLGLDDLTDVDLTTSPPVTGELLIYNGTTSNFEPGTLSADDLSDIDTSTTAPSNGDVLTWNSTASNWLPAAPTGGGGGTTLLHTAFYYQVLTAPTSVVSGSDLLGKNLGQFLELTDVNTSSNAATGPRSAAFNPTLTGITFNASTGRLENIEQGRYLVNFDADIYINNPTPLFLTSPPRLYMEPLFFTTTTNAIYEPAAIWHGLLPYASYGSAQAAINYSVSFYFVTESATASNNIIEIYLDQDQGPAYYVDRAKIEIIKFGDI